MRGDDLMQTIFSSLSLGASIGKMPTLADVVEQKKCKLGSAPLMQSYYVSRAKEARVVVLYNIASVTARCQQTTSVALPRRAVERRTYCMALNFAKHCCNLPTTKNYISLQYCDYQC